MTDGFLAAQLALAHRPSRGGKLKIIAAILEQLVIEKFLMHPFLQARAARNNSAWAGTALCP